MRGWNAAVGYGSARPRRGTRRGKGRAVPHGGRGSTRPRSSRGASQEGGQGEDAQHHGSPDGHRRLESGVGQSVHVEILLAGIASSANRPLSAHPQRPATPRRSPSQRSNLSSSQNTSYPGCLQSVSRAHRCRRGGSSSRTERYFWSLPVTVSSCSCDICAGLVTPNVCRQSLTVWPEAHRLHHPRGSSRPASR